MEFLDNNGYEYEEVMAGVKLCRITNLDLKEYNNIDNIYINYESPTFMYITFKKICSKIDNYGLDINFDTSRYILMDNYFLFDKTYVYISAKLCCILAELKKFKLKGEYIKG